MDSHVFPFQLEVGIRSSECRHIRLDNVPFTRWWLLSALLAHAGPFIYLFSARQHKHNVCTKLLVFDFLLMQIRDR